MMKKLLTILFLLPIFAYGSIFYASPTGTGTGSGSLASPFALQTVLNQPATVHAGDTIYLLAGTYTGNFISNLTGTLNQPIILKNNPGERVIIDGSRAGQAIKNINTFTINGAYTWYIGLEVTNSDLERSIPQPDSNPPERRGEGVVVFGVGVKVINFIIHDCGEGINAWTPATNSEYYGNVIFNNGWSAPDGLHGHGVYTQNDIGTKKYIDNIIVNNFGNGWQIYGSANAQINNFYLEGNTVFNDRCLIGGGSPLRNIELNSNFAYKDAQQFGYISTANDGLILRNNYFPATIQLYWWKNVNATNNTIFNGNMPSAPISLLFNGVPDLSTFHFDSNIYYWSAQLQFTQAPATWKNTVNNTEGIYYLTDWKQKGQDANETTQNYQQSGNMLLLTGKKVFVRKNKYDANRANIVIYNWDKSSTVNIPVAGVLTTGDQYEMHNVQNYFGDVITGTFTGTDSLGVPMTGHTVALPLGYATAQGPNTFPEFGTFILIRKPVVVNQCCNIDSLISLITVMQGQIITLQNSINTIGASAAANATAALVRITALEASILALQNRITNLKATTTIQ